MAENSSAQISALLSADEYLTERTMSKVPVLLVEGDMESCFFQLARDEYCSRLSDNLSDEMRRRLRSLQIDTPAIIASPAGEKLGNREKVESVCELADANNLDCRLVGFVDREFRMFRVADTICDELNTQHRIGRLWWTRGHSIENYVFDFALLRTELRALGISAHFDVTQALTLLDYSFETVLRDAYAASRVAQELGFLTNAHRTISDRHFSYDGICVRFSHATWCRTLREKQGYDEDRVSRVPTLFTEQQAIAQVASIDDIRWSVHGHVGEAFIWAAFLASVNVHWDSIALRPECRKITLLTARDRVLKYLGAFVHSIVGRDTTGTPVECFRDLGIAC